MQGWYPTKRDAFCIYIVSHRQIQQQTIGSCYHLRSQSLYRISFLTVCWNYAQVLNQLLCCKSFRHIKALSKIYTFSCRLGEAKNPGPFLGSLNPNGIMGKMCDLSSLPSPGLWAVQETHLTGMGIRKFKDEIRWAKSNFHLSHGHPVEPKTNALTTIGGKHSGVAFLSSFPIRNLNHCWTQDEFATGRCHAAAAFVQNQWIHAGTVYGYANQACNLDTQQDTDSLLMGLTKRIVDGAVGPRFVAGDWNIERDSIPQADYWESLGWKEAQVFANEKWGQPIRATCRNTTVKDFVYLSPELQQLIVAVTVDNTLCPDHAAILVELEDLGVPEPQTIWRKPIAIQWEAIGTLPVQSSSVEGTQDQKFRQIFTRLEQRANEQLQLKQAISLNPSQLGRATTVEVDKIHRTCAPIKQNRKGDIQSELPFATLTHSRWTRQIRRLQHLARAVCSSKETADMTEHLASLWGKIKQAVGFPKNFPHWWMKIGKTIQGSPDILPVTIPTPSEAFSIFQEFQIHYRALEKTLKDDRLQKAKDRRKVDHMLIYQDLQPDRADPVTTLVRQKHHHVTRVQDGDDLTKIVITVDSPIPITSDTSLLINDQPIGHKMLTDKQVETNVDVHHVLGDSIQSNRLLGKVTEIIKEFNQEWGKRWQNPHHNPQNWEPIVAFAKLAVPNNIFQFPVISRQTWRRAVKGKKAKAATGPDGISKQDLAHLPDDLLDQLLVVLQHTEQTGEWPTQMLVGIVAALAKHPGAAKVTEYRPITVLSMCYRVWATIRAKQCLRAIAQIAPHSIQGNLPGRSPKQVWYHLQAVIEHSQTHQMPLSGMILDIVKCFNMLPREPLLEIGIGIGLPDEVIRPWTSALVGLQRRFQIRGNTGEPIQSTSGFPEGCPLSVVAMALTNLVLERWMYHKYPRVQTWSFVDNIETLGQTAQDATDTFNALTDFCDLLDLEVDRDKSFVWANNQQHRAELREQELPVQMSARDLGGHMNYTRYSFNSTVTQKIHKFKGFWKKLARSSAPRDQKLRALKVSAWPNIFYSISTVTLGPHHFVPLRTQATKACNLHQYGSNPMLQMSCVGDTSQDPEFWCLFETIKSFRKYQIAELAFPVLQQLTLGARVNPGPCHATLRAIHKLGWHWTDNGHCMDQNGLPIDLIHCPIQELYARTKTAWQTRIFAETELTRQTMKGLANASASSTLAEFSQHNDDDQGLLRCALNGTLYTNDALYHAGKAESTKCAFCEHPDSIRHRHGTCPFFQDLWEPFAAQFEDDIVDAPECTLHHGWITANPHIVELKRALQKLPNLATKFFVNHFEHQPNILDIFTDGGCINPKDEFQRIATWGTTLWMGDHFVPLSSGGVPGWHQTGLRGEIWALGSALQFIALASKPARVWTDNQTVFDRVHSYLIEPPPDFSTIKDGDLWHWIYHQLRQVKNFLSEIIKVRSHLDPADQDEEVDAWATQGNAKADAIATQARDHLPENLWKIWSKVVEHDKRTKIFRKALHSLFMQVGKRAIRNKQMQQPPIPIGFDHQENVEVDSQLCRLSRMGLADIPDHFRTDETEHILNWLSRVTKHETQGRWVSWHQMLLLYQGHTGRKGPRNLGRRWRSSNYHKTTSYSFPSYAMWFSHYINNLCRALKIPLNVKYLRTPSHVITYWCGCLRIMITSEELDRLDDFIRAEATNLPVRNISRDLQNIPVVQW